MARDNWVSRNGPERETLSLLKIFQFAGDQITSSGFLTGGAGDIVKPGVQAPGFTMDCLVAADLEPKTLQRDRPAAAGLEPEEAPQVRSPCLRAGLRPRIWVMTRHRTRGSTGSPRDAQDDS
jgi:hypothetical protein